MIKNFFDCKFSLRFLLDPYIRYKADRLGDYSGVNEIKRSVPIIVSIATSDDNFDDLEISLYSLINQSVKPDRIILWLSDDYNDLSSVPYFIKKYIKNGIEVRFVKDLGAYTKTIYALKEFSDSVIVTAEGNAYYKKDWLKKLYHSYIANSKDIQCHMAGKIRKDENGNLGVLNKHILYNDMSAKFENFSVGAGGILYPPNCFVREVFRDDIYLKYAKGADEIWFWFMALLSGRKTRLVKSYFSTISYTNPFRWFKRSNALSGKTDKQIKSLMKFYGENIKIKLAAKNK